jgi:hypothetical protein
MPCGSQHRYSQSLLPPGSEKEEAPEYFVLPFNVEEETPTLVQQQQRHKEVHELIGETKASLNDKLKAGKN